MPIHQIFILQIADLAKRGHFQLACGRYFELTHAAKADELEAGFSPNHPNQYFEESQKLLNGERKCKLLFLVFCE